MNLQAFISAALQQLLRDIVLWVQANYQYIFGLWVWNDFFQREGLSQWMEQLKQHRRSLKNRRGIQCWLGLEPMTTRFHCKPSTTELSNCKSLQLRGGAFARLHTKEFFIWIGSTICVTWASRCDILISIVNGEGGGGRWFGSSANIRGANKDAKI